MFGWFKRLAVESLDDQALAFVKGLCEAHSPDVGESKWGVSYEAILHFPDLTVTVEYWWSRGRWAVEMWCGRAGEFLFYNDCLSPPMTKTIAYLRERFDLDEKVNVERKNRGDKDRTGKEIADELIRKYSG